MTAAQTAPTIHESLEAFLQAPLTPCEGLAGHIAFPDSQLDFSYVERGSRNLVVCFSGAKTYGRDYVPPIFSGQGVCASVGASALMISDPVFRRDNDLMLGWYIGSRHTPAQSAIVALVERILSISAARRVIFLGGSGGGFAALAASRAFADSLAIVWNPQVRIRDYLEDVRRAYVRSAFDIAPGEEDAFLDDPMFDLAHQYAQPPRLNRIIYLQNTRDHRHVTDHMRPFLRNYTKIRFHPDDRYSENLTRQVYLHLDDFGPGHSPPGKGPVARLLKTAVRCKDDWSAVMTRPVIHPIMFGAVQNANRRKKKPRPMTTGA